MTVIDAKRLEAAYSAGFANSSEGYNAEYPFDGDFESDEGWLARRRENINRLCAYEDAAPKGEVVAAWEDRTDELTAAINASHPTKSGRHDTYMRAHELVGRLDRLAGMIEMGERIGWGSDSSAMREAATALREKEAEIARLRHAVLTSPCPYPIAEAEDDTAAACMRAGVCGCNNLAALAKEPDNG